MAIAACVLALVAFLSTFVALAGVGNVARRVEALERSGRDQL